MRVPITITNVNKFNKVTNKWYVRIGKKWRVFGQRDWENGGVDWINAELGGKVNG